MNTFETVMGKTNELTARVDAAAALAARLQALDRGIALPPAVEAALDRVVEASGLTTADLVALAPEQRTIVIGFIRAFFQQSAELIAPPERAPGWTHEDPLVLQNIGKGSMSIAKVVRAIAPQLGDLAARLDGGGRFLDVGTGVGWLAIALAREFPALHVTGIDIWKPSLALAATNITPLADRIELREQDVLALPDRDAFDAAFLAGPFLPREVIPGALERLHVALAPGGWLLFGLFAGAPEPIAEAVTELRVVRGGGHPWRQAEVIELVDRAGFAEVRALERTWSAPVAFVVGRRT